MKTKIVQNATEMFLDLGFKSVTMDDIATKIGISKKTIYTNFKNKEELVEACSIYIFEQINGIIKEIEKKQFNPIEETFKIKEVISHYLKGDKTSPEFQLKKYFPSIHKKLNNQKKEIINTCFKNNLRKGIEQGYFRPDINIDLIAKFYYLCVSAIKNDEIFVNDNVNDALLYYLEYHIRAIASEKGTKTLNKILNK